MIFDKIVNFHQYNFPEAVNICFEQLLGLNENSPEGSIQLGSGIKINISDYETRPLSEAKPETHRRFIDIQAVLRGHELVGWYPDRSLLTSEPYNPEKDVEFYQKEEILFTPVHLPLEPGYFMIFFPWDIHMPQLTPGDKNCEVKKAVCKIPLDLWD